MDVAGDRADTAVETGLESAVFPILPGIIRSVADNRLVGAGLEPRHDGERPEAEQSRAAFSRVENLPESLVAPGFVDQTPESN